MKIEIDFNAIDLKKYLPHRDPFLFVDKIIDCTQESIITTKLFNKEMDFYKGHFPNFPLTPGVILLEAQMQSACIFMNLISSLKQTENHNSQNQIAVASRINEVKFKDMVFPQDEIKMHVSLVEQLANAFYFKGITLKNDKKIVISNFTCTLTKAI